MADDPTKDLAAALDNHQITDDQGKIVEEQTSTEEPAPSEEAPVKEEATAEKPADEGNLPKEEPKSENEPEMVELASDETGKRYVPESRFKEVYAKLKRTERALEERTVERPVVPPAPQVPLNKTDALEVELLRSTLPQFNEESDQYSREIDELGYSIYQSSKDGRGNHTLTRLEAGRKALQMAKKITSKVADIKAETRTVKAQQSDQGITNRVLNREGQKLDVNKMTLEEKEAWLKANGYW